MDNVVIVEVLDAFHDLSEEINCLILAQLPLLLQVVIEIVVAEFSDDVHVIAGLEDIMKLHYIFVTDLFHDVYLRMQVFKVEIACEDSLVYNFDSNWLSSLYYFPLVDGGV